MRKFICQFVKILTLAVSLCVSINAFAADTPAIFGVGFTNITDNSVKIVFTTLEQTTGTVELKIGNTVAKQVTENDASEIHRIDVNGLTPGTTYAVAIHATTAGGVTGDATGFTFTAKAHPANIDRFAGKMLFGIGGAERCEEAFMQIGAGTTRLGASWDWIEPRPGQINRDYLNKLVGLVDRCLQAGVTPVILLGYGNDWAQQYTKQQVKYRHIHFGPPDAVQDWKNYVKLVMQTLKGKAVYYEVWNEPDAGYLADGKPVERQVDGVQPTKSVFINNDEYWLGDRYMPLVIATREVADEVDPGIKILGGSWNHDYHATRGTICFNRGMKNYIQQYCFHNYAGSPQSYARWEYWTDNRYFTYVDKLLAKNDARMPIVISEYGLETYDEGKRPQNSGFSSRRDGQLFAIKSAFYYLSKQCVSMVIYFTLTGTQAWNLVDLNTNGEPTYYPAYYSYQWVCKTFNNQPYTCLPVTTDAGKDVRAYAVKLAKENTTYLACWQQAYNDVQNTVVPQPTRTVNMQVSGLENGAYTIDELDVTGKVLRSTQLTVNGPWKVTISLPESTTERESELVLYRLTKTTK